MQPQKQEKSSIHSTVFPQNVALIPATAQTTMTG